ncbi:predicted protein [Naegleria gruberi]|uniref:Predicted protein n=1 Tax=Naegleria gruberi TaxID=5762 RepID=D2VHP9_NAEGR|nr:uncharacterized protein NAEGRDRAFT_68403 [Naegleria gruberi]EFC43630.1 predicted protein [Naegleria gruberi]|eukprot:XP_002676374.1 predicted protein [Naegleria gruberi strain NEG-M]
MHSIQALKLNKLNLDPAISTSNDESDSNKKKYIKFSDRFGTTEPFYKYMVTKFELVHNHLLNICPVILMVLVHNDLLSPFWAVLIQQYLTIIWTLSLHSLLHAKTCVDSNQNYDLLTDILIGIPYFGLFTPSIAKFGHDTHHNYTGTEKDLDHFFFKTENPILLFIYSSFFSEYYIFCYLWEKSSEKMQILRSVSIMLVKLVILLTMYKILGNSFLIIFLSSRFAKSYIFASFTQLVHKIDLETILFDLEERLNLPITIDTILHYTFGYNIHVVKYHDDHHAYRMICPSAYYPALHNYYKKHQVKENNNRIDSPGRNKAI